MKNRNRIVLGLLVATQLVVACKGGDLEFQSFQPKSETALSDLFLNTPAIKAAFTTINPQEFNLRLDNLIRTDPVMGVKSMHAIGSLSKDRPALPQLADSVSSIIERFAKYYQATDARKTEYNAAIDLVNRLLDVDPKAMTDATYLLARGLKYAGESAPLFYISATHPDVTRVNEYKYPALSTWKTCDDPGSVFLNTKPASDITDFEGRDTIWALYDVLRTGFCIYANRTGPRIEFIATTGSGATAEAVITNGVITAINVTNGGANYVDGATIITIDSSPGPGVGATATPVIEAGRIAAINVTSGGGGFVPKSDNTPGAFMRNATAVLKNSGDIELRVRNLIYDLQNKLADYSASEKKIADWTVNQSNLIYQTQVAVTDYLIDYIYPITRKDFVFDQGKEVLDRQAEFMSMKNPGNAGASDEYLTQWLLEALNTDAAKLDDLENFSNIDTTSRLYVFGKDIVENPTSGIRSVTSRYAQALLTQHVWGPEVSYIANTVGMEEKKFKGLLFQNGAADFAGDGYLSALAQVRSTEVSHNSFRNFMGSRVNSLVSVPANYGNELYLESALKNIYFHVLDRYYDQNTKQWALTAEDAQVLFPTDPNPAERNLQGYIANMQYSLRNMSMLDKYGKLNPGLPGYNATNDLGYDPDRVPYLTAFIYTIAAANGYVDPVNAPPTLQLKDCLKSMGSPLYPSGQININALWGLINMTVAVLNAPQTPSLPPLNSATRQDEAASTNLNMFAFELVSPGRFIPRTDTERYPSDPVNGKFRGSFSAHQGDIESTGLKTSNWMAAEMSLAGWEGYGPYTVKGRAANGSKHKYENDYFTDGYRAAIGTGYGFSGPPTSFSEVAMGENGGDGGGTLGNDRNGNYHMYEMIYRPMNSGDLCWTQAQGPTYGYARYGWLRPSNNVQYTDLNVVTGGCNTTTMVQLDFDTRDEAIRANVEWVLKFKKYIFIIPISSFSDATVWQGATFAVFSSINANGLWGVTTGKRYGSALTDNSRWNKLGVGMGADANGYIASALTGFVNEAPAGGRDGVTIHKTTRFGITSFMAGDSMVMLETTLRKYGGLIGLLVDLWQQIWDSLGNGPVTPAMVSDNFDSVLTLAQAKYMQSDVLTGTVPAHRAAPAMAQYQAFFNVFFPTNETTCVGGVLSYVAGGGPDLFENFQNGCGVTARDLPPIPKVNPDVNNCNEFVQTSCLKYPKAYDPTTGAVTQWFDYKGPSEGKLTGMLTPLIMLFGTMHEDGQIMKTTTYPNATPLAAGENRDNISIRNYCSADDPACSSANYGFRVHLNTLFDALASINETHKKNANNLPQYETGALTNILTETAAGLRNGLVPRITNNKYANVAYIDPLIRDLESMISDNVRAAEDSFEVTKGTGTTMVAPMKNKDKLRYFSTKNVINPTLTPALLISSPGVVSLKYHGLELNDEVTFTTTGTLPTGLAPSTKYYVISPVTADTFRLSLTLGGGAINFTGVQSGTHTLYPPHFKSNRFDQSVNGIALNGVPINMMKSFIAYLRTLTADAEIIAAIKKAIPIMNNYFTNVMFSSTQITLTDKDIDNLVGFIKDTNKSGQYSVDSFLDMVVSTKMDDLNTLRSFNFEQFKTLGSYQSIFDDMNDKVYKYFDVDIKKDLLYSSFMLGEPTCPGGSANGFYDHNKDGVWNSGTFTFISAAYASGATYTDTANVNGSCSIVTPIPDLYDKDYYMFDMGGVARNIESSVKTLTAADVDDNLNFLYGRNLLGTQADVLYGANPNNAGKVECYISSASSGGGINFDREIKALKNLILCKAYNTKIAEPHYDRNANNVIEAGEYTDINMNTLNGNVLTPNGQYDDENSTTHVNLRNFITYYMENVFQPKYQELKVPDVVSPNKNYITFAANALKDLLAPTVCGADGLGCSANPQYLTAELLNARKTFYASTNFTSAELKSVKNVIGNFLYDQETGEYTNLIQRTGPSMITLLREFQGDYNDLLNMGLEGFAPNGFMTYFSTNLKNKAPYTSLDILTDVRTLFNTQAMRCYPGITKEYAGGASYCKKYKAGDTFWGQFGLLMDQFSTSAYNKYKAQWQGQMNSAYYSRLVSIFQ